MKNNNPYLICEISANHCGDIKIAKKLILTAKKNGGDAVKLQTFTPETMTLNSNKHYFNVKDGLWKGYSLWKLYEEAQTPLNWHKELFSYAKKIGIKIFSTPFDETAVDFLEKLNCPIYKVSSFEMTDLYLIKKICKTKKPIIISTGMASLEEIEIAYNTAKKNGAKDITLLYCVSNYPSNLDDFNLENIKILQDKFKCKIGLSDHSTDNRVAITAAALGAQIFEKHIALENQKKGLDIKFSLKGNQIKKFKEDITIAHRLKGKKNFFRNSSEKKSKTFRRSLFIAKDIKKGQIFTKENLRRIRPGHGTSPIYFEKILGKQSPINIKKETPFKKSYLKKLNIKKI